MSPINKLQKSALRHGMLLLPQRKTSVDMAVANATAIEMANLGFIVDPIALQKASTKDLVEAVNSARSLIGADRDMKPVYPGFPQQVASLDTSTLLLEQIRHYWSYGAYLPNYPEIVREDLPIADMLSSARELKVVTTNVAAKQLLQELSSAKTAISEADRELMYNAAENCDLTIQEITEMCKNAGNGENMQTLVLALNATDIDSAELFKAVVPTCFNIDKLLRTVLAIFSEKSAPEHELEYNLAVTNLSNKNFYALRMKNMPRSCRRVLLTRLGEVSTGQYADNLVKRIKLWQRIMKAVHPYDFNLLSNEMRAVDIIHSNIEYRTLNSLIECALEQRNVSTAVTLLAENRPGELLRRLVAILRLVKSEEEATFVAQMVRNSASTAALTTLISSYNGVMAANDDHERIIRVANLNNTMIERNNTKIDENYVKIVTEAILAAISDNLATKNAPTGTVGTLNNNPVPLVQRDLATSDRVLDRGESLTPDGSGKTLRFFGHWYNNQNHSGYMDIGVIVLDKNYKTLTVSTWNTWSANRSWSTYSGDKCVTPGDSATEYIDVNIASLKKAYPEAASIAMSVQSWSGFPMKNVDFIAGLMYRSDSEKGEVFDPRTVQSAFKPTTKSTQSIPYVYNIATRNMIWIDSSNGSTKGGVSASNDTTIGDIVHSELGLPRLTLGELAERWAKAHNAEIDPFAEAPKQELLKLL